jgi:hypothetical protein
MNEQQPLYNSRVAKIYMRYLEENYPDMPLDPILNEVGILPRGSGALVYAG